MDVYHIVASRWQRKGSLLRQVPHKLVDYLSQVSATCSFHQCWQNELRHIVFAGVDSAL
jgi:hypothetical protein